MLVLSRKKTEAIVIVCPDGTRLRIVVTEIRGDKARIGLHAPNDYVIHRDEVQQAIDAEVTA